MQRIIRDDARAWSAAASETVIEVVSDWTPLLVAAVPAAAIARGLWHLDLSTVLIVLVAVGVELVGILAGHTLAEAREARAAGRTHGLWWVTLALGCYAFVGISYAVLLDVWPSVMTFAVAHGVVLFDLRSLWPAFLTLLAIMAYWLRSERRVIRQQQGGAHDAQEEMHDGDAAASPSGAVARDTNMAGPASSADASASATDAQAAPYLVVGASASGQELPSGDATAVSEWRIVAPVMQTEPVVVQVTTNGNGHHAQEDAQNVCKRCGQAYGKGNAGSHWTWDCTANPDRRKRKGAA